MAATAHAGLREAQVGGFVDETLVVRCERRTSLTFGECLRRRCTAETAMIAAGGRPSWGPGRLWHARAPPLPVTGNRC